MVFNTATVGSAVTPAIISTFFSHYLNRSERHKKPTAHISYDEGIHLIRKFLAYSSHHSVEDIQRFTAQWVPHPTWVKVDEEVIDDSFIEKAAASLQIQLGPDGIDKVGGKTWWQWRRPESKLEAEWIEMKSDYNKRKKTGAKSSRIMLYVHGGAYFFGSVDEHRYQLQRHARKLKARVFAPRYRLAPQFPFPCGLHDCLSAYLYLLSIQKPETIVFAGDSAGGGMIMSLLVILRDQNLPLPAGAILISPWVDLTHSFPSVSGENPLDYIPEHGFHHRPSPDWPPPNANELRELQKSLAVDSIDKKHPTIDVEKDAIQGFRVVDPSHAPIANTVPGSIPRDLSVMIDGKLVEIKDQIQMYTTNALISHRLVSPILQPSLGGLCPVLILTGGGEMLRDEQIYLAHKLSCPEKYPPGDAFLDEYDRTQIKRWNPTDCQLQVWDDLCHVAPTLSFTHPAKHMYRSVAQFSAWALARAQKTAIEILHDDDVSVISNSSSEMSSDSSKLQDTPIQNLGRIGQAGDPLPPFEAHMIRQRVDRHGAIFALDPASALPGCNMKPSEIGVVKEGPVTKWMAAKAHWDQKYASSKLRVQKLRLKEMAKGYQTFGDGEVPPPSALAGRIESGKVDKHEKKSKSMGMAFWSLLGSKHDKATMDREQKDSTSPGTVTATANDGAGARALHDREKRSWENTSSEDHLSPNDTVSNEVRADRLETDIRRPKLDGIAFPFSLKQKDKNSSMTTLTSTVGVEAEGDVLNEGAGLGGSGGGEEKSGGLQSESGRELPLSDETK